VVVNEYRNTHCYYRGCNYCCYSNSISSQARAERTNHVRLIAMGCILIVLGVILLIVKGYSEPLIALPAIGIVLAVVCVVWVRNNFLILHILPLKSHVLDLGLLACSPTHSLLNLFLRSSGIRFQLPFSLSTHALFRQGRFIVI
jgi:hypothetical protein